MDRRHRLREIIPFRQIHLDFYTSEKIEGICADFDAEKFAQTLEDAHVNSITLYSCCHHGMLYYDSKKYPQMVHPHLVHSVLLRVAACYYCFLVQIIRGNGFSFFALRLSDGLNSRGKWSLMG